ncbi:hypothetical protein H0H81_005362 [Sphagnurus paluster]|uniref:Uncharacterized protein n=1 Tax=Sphagnurus paluster TaxID=117069 RepID=A0A9P7GLR7_9AGAR|nr:hypothetical protein H0H81_005362 [Sphagnurus paluster]
MNNPSADDPFEPEIAAVLKNDKARFMATAKEYTKNKKSETARSAQVPPAISSDSEEPQQDSSPQIPLPNDFRTSLILPDLSRRFSLLRSSSGEPVALDILRNRLADQRARGAANHISEEEEEMIFDTLRSFRSPRPAPPVEENQNTMDTEDFRQSTSTMQSSLAPSVASVTSSPSGRSTRRYSNNLFGSGRFHDYNYIRSVTKNGSARTSSLTPTESSYRGNTSSVVDSLRPVTPESSGPSSSTHSSPNPNEHASSVRLAPLAAPVPYGEQLLSVAEYRISKTLGSSAAKRASMALEEAIKEIEEEAEDEILIQRTIPVPRANVEIPSPVESDQRSSTLSQSSIFEAVMAISSDKQVQSDPEVIDRRASPVPSRILPGYVPGMPRPMTPRDFDLEEQRSHSTTPRATSPAVTNLVDTSVASISNLSTTGRLRSNSSTSQSGSRSPTSPLFLQRSPNSGRYTPEENTRVEFDSPLNSSLLSRRRPASPLSGPAYQPMAVSSRPSTPSNIIWTPNRAQHQQRPSSGGHSRNGSTASDSGTNSDVHGAHGAHERYTSGPRPMRSPPLPDSPIEGANFPMGSFSYDHSSSSLALAQNGNVSPEMTPAEFGSPRRQPPRSVTPTQNATRSPTSPTFPDYSTSPSSNRSSKQSVPSALVPPLVFSPLVNSSRSSLASTGSSYHTWEGEEKDRSLSLFGDPDMLQPVWHDLSASSTSVAAGNSSPDEDWKPEEVVARIAGLKKSDFIAIQEKLLHAKDAKEKDKYEPTMDRAASALRKRRPSTSQSHYSVGPRVASPPPQVQSPVKTSPVTKAEQSPSAIETNIVASPSFPREREISPTTRRNRDLAQALFGREENESGSTSKSESTGQTAQELTKPVTTKLETQSSSSTLSPSFSTPYQQSKNPSVPRIPQTPQEEEELAREVQEKIKAATQLLKPANGNHSPDPQATISRKRISPSQISTPHLISTSTSIVDTVPIKSTSVAPTTSSAPSKIGSRFKKLRGTLRAKNPLPNGEDVFDPQTPSAVQAAHYDPTRLKVPTGSPATAGATETRYKVPVPSPPASAGPGLKGFMARFRGKRPAAELSVESERRKSPQQQSPQPPSPLPTSPPATAPPGRTFTQPRTSPVGRKPAPVERPESPQASASAPPTKTVYEQSASTEPAATDSSDLTALRQFLEAANKIGIDQGDLNALLARSGSTSKADWAALARSNSAVRPGAASPVDSTRLAPANRRPSIDDQSMRALTPDTKGLQDRGTGRPSVDARSTRDKAVSRQGSRRQADHTRRPREGKGGDTAVVRKTIIVPDTNMTAEELEVFMEKSWPRRRASMVSTSGRSVHERSPTPRSPTPPLPRSPTRKRFSDDGSPPVPNLPAGLGNSLAVPLVTTNGSIEKSNSTYDSLYDMYAGESRYPSATPNEPGPSRIQDDSALAPESGAAVELIHLANGETIWNIVNGLREDDDDDASIYTKRTSYASEYSPRGTNDGGLQIFVKEHGRSSSKGSGSSFISRKKPQGKLRPETKVFYSATEGIGRLIQELSQTMEAGSFNVVPRPGHSASSSLSTSDMTWTVEEQLDEMMNRVRAQ